jgi:hypothetical protein
MTLGTLLSEYAIYATPRQDKVTTYFTEQFSVVQ